MSKSFEMLSVLVTLAQLAVPAPEGPPADVVATAQPEVSIVEGAEAPVVEPLQAEQPEPAGVSLTITHLGQPTADQLAAMRFVVERTNALGQEPPRPADTDEQVLLAYLDIRTAGLARQLSIDNALRQAGDLLHQRVDAMTPEQQLEVLIRLQQTP